MSASHREQRFQWNLALTKLFRVSLSQYSEVSIHTHDKHLYCDKPRAITVPKEQRASYIVRLTKKWQQIEREKLGGFG